MSHLTTRTAGMQDVRMETRAVDGWLYLYLRPTNPLESLILDGCCFVHFGDPELGRDSDGDYVRFQVKRPCGEDCDHVPIPQADM